MQRFLKIFMAVLIIAGVPLGGEAYQISPNPNNKIIEINPGDIAENNQILPSSALKIIS